MNSYMVKNRHNDTYYEIQYVIHPRSVAHGCDVFACYRLSATDGMPIGSRVWIALSDLCDSDQRRLTPEKIASFKREN